MLHRAPIRNYVIHQSSKRFRSVRFLLDDSIARKQTKNIPQLDANLIIIWLRRGCPLKPAQVASTNFHGRNLTKRASRSFQKSSARVLSLLSRSFVDLDALPALESVDDEERGRKEGRKLLETSPRWLNGW